MTLIMFLTIHFVRCDVVLHGTEIYTPHELAYNMQYCAITLHNMFVLCFV